MKNKQNTDEEGDQQVDRKGEIKDFCIISEF